MTRAGEDTRERLSEWLARVFRACQARLQARLRGGPSYGARVFGGAARTGSASPSLWRIGSPSYGEILGIGIFYGPFQIWVYIWTVKNLGFCAPKEGGKMVNF